MSEKWVGHHMLELKTLSLNEAMLSLTGISGCVKLVALPSITLNLKPLSADLKDLGRCDFEDYESQRQRLHI